MSTASGRLISISNHLQSSNMAAASNFYSIIAGVGAGTGQLHPKSMELSQANLNINRTFRGPEIRKGIPSGSLGEEPRQLRIDRERDQSHRWPSHRHFHRCLLRILHQECICGNTEGVQGKEACGGNLQRWWSICQKAVLGDELRGV